MTDCGPPAGFLKPTWSETREQLKIARGFFLFLTLRRCVRRNLFIESYAHRHLTITKHTAICRYRVSNPAPLGLES